MKKTLTFLILFLLFNTVTFAEIKTFTKEATEVIPENQSQAQVIAYLTQKLTRQATEEAGLFINTEFSVKNKEITKDEFTSVAGSISKVVVKDKETFTKDNQQYVKVKINIEVDTDSIQPYLDKILQDNQYKREADELRKKTLELEEKLKTATKKQYEQELSAQVQQQMELQKQRAIELNKMAIQAKEEYAKAEQSQKQQEIKRQEELNALKKQIEQENLKTQQKIAQEKDNIKKAELENQAKIQELENKAKENMINWQQSTNKTTIEQAIEEATKVKQEVNELFEKFEKLSKTNKEDLIKSYDTQINILKTNGFQEQEPIKDSWETQNEYNLRLQKYESDKKIFEENADKKIKELENTKDDNLLKEEMGTLNSTINTTKPFIDKLKYFQTEKFYSKDGIKAKLISVGEINAEEQYFILNVNYENKDYSLKYNFSNIGREKAKLMCQTQNQFIIEPLFSVNNNLAKELSSFNIKHLGTNLETNIDVSININKFDEIERNTEYNIKFFCSQVSVAIGSHHIIGLQKDGSVLAVGNNEYGQCNVKLLKGIKQIAAGTNHTVMLAKDGFILSLGSNEYGQSKILWKRKEKKDIVAIFAGYDTTVGLQEDGTILVAGNNINNCNGEWRDIKEVAIGSHHMIGLKKDGTVVSGGYNGYKQCDIKSWKDIVAIATGDNHTVGLKKDGTVIATGNNDFDQCNVKNWENIVLIATGDNHTVGLKKDGTVIATGDNKYGQCNVEEWKDIYLITAGYYKTVGVKSDGTVLVVGNNKFDQCDVSHWNLKNNSKENQNIVKNIPKIYNCPHCGYYYSNGILEDDTFCIRCKGKFN